MEVYILSTIVHSVSSYTQPWFLSTFPWNPLSSFMCSFLTTFVCNFIVSQNKKSKSIPCSINSFSGNLAYKWEDEMWPNKRIYFYFNFNLFPGGLLCLLRRWPNQFCLHTDFFISKVKKHFGIIITGEWMSFASNAKSVSLYEM